MLDFFFFAVFVLKKVGFLEFEASSIGAMDGTVKLGFSLGFVVGVSDGVVLGEFVKIGCTLGILLGALVGISDGSTVSWEGVMVG